MSGPPRVVWSTGDHGSEIIKHHSVADPLDNGNAISGHSSSSVSQPLPPALKQAQAQVHRTLSGSDCPNDFGKGVTTNEHAHPNGSWQPVLAPDVIRTAQYSRRRRGLPPHHMSTTSDDFYYDSHDYEMPAHDVLVAPVQDSPKPKRSSRHHRPTAMDISPSPPPIPHRRVSHPRSSLSTSTVDGASPRSLRRTKRHSQMRKKSSRSLRSRASSLSPSNPHATETSPRKGKEPVSLALSSTSAPECVPNVRLGHPSRPYYTAIRKNMSRPSTPFGPHSANDSSAHPPPSPVRSTFSQARPSMDYAPSAVVVPQRMSVPARRGGTSGWSVSGEMEMHIALAARRSADAPHVRQEYVFYDTPQPLKEKVSKMRRLGQGLKKLVLGRS
ncbi:hypothetical protein OF83DRAFT_1084066 [Amylostereum chailletii]|nr:hypothetical protein OF83DRAFT_1084066 [Amylostereum chailletii]